MKVVTISTDGVSAGGPVRVNGDKAYLYHGESGRGRREVRIPFRISTYGITVHDIDKKFIAEQHHRLVENKYGHYLEKGEDDGTFLVLWHLSPGYRGGATYFVRGNARVIAEGYKAQGAAGRMGGAPCPVVHVGPGTALLTWERTGRLYGEPAHWVAYYSGDAWDVMDRDELLAALAIGDLEENELITEYLEATS